MMIIVSAQYLYALIDLLLILLSTNPNRSDKNFRYSKDILIRINILFRKHGMITFT